MSRCTKLGDYGKKASFAALNWETQPRELYLNRRPAILFTLRDFSWKLMPSSRANIPTSNDSHELAPLDQFSLAKGLANLGAFRQRGTRSLFIVPNPSRLNGPAEPGPFSALEAHCRHAENVRAHLAP